MTKPSAIPEKALLFRGPAKIYESEQDALIGIRAKQVHEGEVVVIRNEGPKGGPGMPEMYKVMKVLVGMNLGSKVCVITDGLQDGDVITVDVLNGIIEADVDFRKRRKEVVRKEVEQVKGCLYQYRKNVTTASKGAYIATRTEI